jgi:hypothetical protein
VYVLNNNENLKMSKYIPKVGEAFEWRSEGYKTWHTAGVCIAHSANEVGYESPNGWITTVNKLCEFRPIPTKSDVEREQLLEIIEECYDSGCSIITKEIQQAGFTIPKKIKRSDVLASISDWTDLPNVLTTEICKLLGDLVEQDKGGAE